MESLLASRKTCPGTRQGSYWPREGREKTLHSTSSPEMGQPVSVPTVWSVVIAALLAAFYLATTLYIASHRLFWYDELFTIHVARLSNWGTIWTALAHAIDSQPPIYYLVVRMFDRLVRHSEVAIRLPSALAMVAGLLLTFDCARRLTDGLHGLIALSVLTCSFLPYYGYEARPYAILFMLAALALWVWTNPGINKKWSAIVFGSVLFVAVTIHYYAVLLVVPYALYELSCWRPWRRPSPKLTAGLLGVIVPAALLSPLILSFARQFSTRLWGQPTFQIQMMFSNFFPNGLFLLALVMIWIAWAGRNEKGTILPPMRSEEVVGWLFLCMPLAGFVVAELKSSAFAGRFFTGALPGADRFFIGALPGIAVGFSCCVWRHFRNAVRVSLGVFLVLACTGVARQVTTTRHLEMADRFGEQGSTKWYLGLEDSLRKDGKRFMLFEAPYYGLYLDSEYYSKHPAECILLLPSDAAQQDSWALGVVLNLAQYYPLHFWTLNDLKLHARETALILWVPETSQAMETLQALRQAGFQVEVRFSGPLKVAYLQ